MTRTSSFMTAIIAACAAALPNLPAAAADNGNMISTSQVRAFPAEAGGPMTPVDGSSFLMRTSNGVAFSLDTRALEPDVAYTAWWVVFNAPEQCATPYACGAVDLDNAAVEPGVLFAAGRVADAFGQARFVASIDYGDVPNGEDQVPNPERAHAIAADAEIHIVVRDHGTALNDADAREIQLATFNGGCAEGCRNEQASVHRSPLAPATDSQS